MRDKSAAVFITEALEPLRVLVAAKHPGSFFQLIHEDSDYAVSQWGHGEHQDTLSRPGPTTRTLPTRSSWLGHPQTCTQ